MRVIEARIHAQSRGNCLNTSLLMQGQKLLDTRAVTRCHFIVYTGPKTKRNDTAVR